MKKQLILIPSHRMDSNTKKGRYEDKLIRIGAKARANLGLNDEKEVELWPSTSDMDRISRSRVLTIFKAFSADLKEAKNAGLSPNEYNRVGFVTTNTFDYICHQGVNSKTDIWIAQSIEDTVIGGDPEFVLLTKDNKVKYAASVANFDYNGKLASDGPLAEIRPDPAVTVENFVNNIQEILCNHPRCKNINKYKWISGCCWLGEGEDHNNDRREWPIGGHIHIGTPAIVHKHWNDSDDTTLQDSFYIVLTKVLDELLAIPIMKIDTKNESIKRRLHYGTYGSYHTDHGRLEYRTLSGTWLAHPRLATIVLGTAKAIIDSFFYLWESSEFDIKFLAGGYNPENVDFFDSDFNKWDRMEITRILRATRTSKEMVAILNKYKMSYTKKYIRELKSTLRNLPAYRTYSNYIDTFIELISLPYRKLRRIDRNLKNTWVSGKEFII